jgi:hypothetical protein
MQVTKMIDDARGKHVFSKLSGLKKTDVEKMDLNNPDKDVVVDGKLNDVHTFITPELPSGEMFADFDRTRERMLAKIHVSGPTRGEIRTDVATTSQIAREADFTVADDISEETVNDVATQIGESYLHMIKLRASTEYFQEIVGEEAQELELRLDNDLIEDGMEVVIFASGTDKLKAERQAKEEAQLGIIDPISYYKDTNRSDAEERAERLFFYQTNPELYYKKFIAKEELPEIANQAVAGSQQALAQVQSGGGQPQQPAMRPSVADTTNIPTTPQGSPRNLIGRAGQALSRMFNR